MKVIVLKKSVLALMRSLGKTTAEIAEHFGIKNKEANDALLTLGLIKQRVGTESKVKEPVYTIQLEDDAASLIGEPVSKPELEEATA